MMRLSLGIELDYEDDWAGVWFGDQTSVQVMALQGTVSYKIHDDGLLPANRFFLFIFSFRPYTLLTIVSTVLA
ncbi:MULTISPECIES: hypothetical protein [Gammaproteobacteria]|uniref:hypothetical protein n=1 Tax=Gammaproteobacteria TaxID=1236 RepID=UPI001ADD0AA1|nr:MULTISPECIES: hypothetical protein [Gammaproteobacteria]MBO9482503.1 hypothetical protein [Salinisphaera sp. G21_0]MBO9493092.1 hypothetical protein [Thalassotalea sp. G20_0]